MNTSTTAETVTGPVWYRAGVDLADLHVGDLVLGLADPNGPDDQLRTLYRVTAPLGMHRTPCEDVPAWYNWLNARMPWRRQRGVLAVCVGEDGAGGAPALVNAQRTPRLDQVGGPVFGTDSL